MTIEVGDAPTTRERRRGPIDPRLWRHSASARGYLILTVALSMVNVVMVIVAALMIGRVLAGVITTRTVDVSSWTTELVVLAAAVAVRVLGTWLQTRYAHRASTRVVAEIKNGVLTSATAMSPRDLDPRRDEIATVVTRGVDGLGPYLTGYLPALVLSVTLTPITLIVIAVQDMTSAVIIFVTLPLIPIFMILIGLLTKGKSEKTLAAMTTLSSQLLDLLAGLPTLRALGRQQGPAERVRELGDAHRRTTMSALRVAFLSSMVLELLATLCVALVAVSIGLRLVYGDMSLEPGIVALILAPRCTCHFGWWEPSSTPPRTEWRQPTRHSRLSRRILPRRRVVARRWSLEAPTSSSTDSVWPLVGESHRLDFPPWHRQGRSPCSPVPTAAASRRQCTRCSG
ncbi:hypothetical protein G9444_5066 [Rhodococcus erythropolis]|uniref:ABC transmembrane type-1 domain-containing protein n=1 Tax=Rhodococcus erythropolis TaxID=1833 RepID=A0A6G9CZG8_RHOER|nr:hypothetical protein G9444_5066 [Rhodococcus erythropolis]